LKEVQNYLQEKTIEWPQIYVGANWDDDIAKRYRMPGNPYLLLVDPEGKIVATELRGQKLTEAVEKAIRQP